MSAVDSDSTPHLSPIVFWGPLGEYSELLVPTTEAPVEFHFGASLAVMSAMFGRSRLQIGTHTHYPTAYVLLAGVTGVTHKTTSVRNAMTFLPLEQCGVPVVNGVGSRVGLMETLKAAMPAPGHPVLLRVPEFTVFLRKAAQKATETLNEFLLDLYDRPALMENHTLGNPIRVEQPAASLLGDSTEEALGKVFKPEAIGAGLLGRIWVFIGDRGDPIPMPPPVDTQRTKQLASRLVALAEKHNGCTMTVGAGVTSYYNDIYCEVYKLQQVPGGEVHARLGDTVWKIAMLYALTDDRRKIEVDDVESAWEVARYIRACRDRLVGRLGRSELDKVLERIEDIVNEHTTGIGTGYISQHLSKHQRSVVNDNGGLSRLLRRLADDERITGRNDGWYPFP
jgi:hypothetical protein